PREVAALHPVIDKEGAYVIRGEDISMDSSVARCLIVSSGRVNSSRLIHTSIVISGNSATIEKSHTSIVICDGDLTIRDGVHDCILIASGVVNCSDFVNKCVIITGKTVNKSERALVTNTTIRQNEPNLLGLVKFFSLAQVGIEVGEGFTVEKVRDRK